MLFSYAKFDGYDLGFFRIGGPGLGNNLFPWARSIVAANKYGLVPIAPIWRQLKIGPFIRNEKDKRLYYGLFKAVPGHVRGWRKFLVLSRSSATADEKDLYAGTIKDTGSDTVVIFKGMDGYFARILKDHAFVRQELFRITRAKHKKSLSFDFSGSISVHVRLTDFALTLAEHDLCAGCSNLRIPLSWYTDMIHHVRAAAGTNMPVYVFSDGQDRELAALLRLPNSQRLTFGSSIADLIALSRAYVLVASGSTFSAWASYLGRMPVIWHSGQMVQKLYYENASHEIQLEKGEPFPAAFSEAVTLRPGGRD